jgi:hypothetical protein
VDAARVVFNAPPSSLIGSNDDRSAVPRDNNEVQDDARGT